MANKKITLKRKSASGYDALYPETKKANILTSSGTALNTFAGSVLQGDQIGSAGYLVGRYAIGSGSSAIHEHAVTLSAADVRSIFEIAQDSHTTAISDISEDAVDLATQLAGKVPLVNSKIPREYFPAINTDSLTFAGTISGGSGTNSATQVSSFFNLQSQWFDSIYDDNDDVVDNQKGMFKIVSPAGYFTNHSGVTADSKTFNFTFRILNTSTSNFEEVDDYQATNSDLALQLEAGDMIVLTEIEKASSTVFNLYFDVINVNYGPAGTGNQQRGIVELSSATVKGSMSSSASSSKIVDEKVFKDVMKDIVELDSYSSITGSTAYQSETSMAFRTTNPTTTTPGSVGDFLINISNGKIFELTSSGGETGPWTWTERTTINQFSESNIKPGRYYDLDGTTFVAKNITTDSTTGTLYALDPVTNDLIFDL